MTVSGWKSHSGANDDSWLACAREQLDSLIGHKEICLDEEIYPAHEDLRDSGLRHQTDNLDPALATQCGPDSKKELFYWW